MDGEVSARQCRTLQLLEGKKGRKLRWRQDIKSGEKFEMTHKATEF